MAIVYYSDNSDFQKKITHGNGVNRYSSRFQHLIWYLTGYFGQGQDSYFMNYLQSDSLMYNAYTDIINRHGGGEIIPDHYAFRYNATHDVTYDFAAFRSTSYYDSFQMLLGFIIFPRKLLKSVYLKLNDQVCR